MVKPLKKLQIGKKGLTPEFIEQVQSIFKHETLIKIHLLKSARENKDEARQIGEQLIEGLGKNFTYKSIGYILVVKKWRKNKR